MSKYVIGIDVGTTSVKGILVDEMGKIIYTSTSPVTLLTPKPGWAEEDPLEWWESSKKILKDINKKYPVKIEAISISGQMHSLVSLDEKNEILRNAILWCDQRTDNECDELTEFYGTEKEVIEIFGNPFLTGFTAPKIQWIKNNEKQNFEKIEKLMLSKDYIAYKLTGNVAIEQSDASGTSLYKVKEGVYDSNLLKKLEIEESKLPEIIQSGGLIGKVDCEDLPFLNGVNIVAGGADNAAAAYGCGIEKPGDAMVSLGTSGTVVAITKSPIEDISGKIHLFGHVMDNTFYHMAVILSATNSLNWFLNNFLENKSLEEINELVEESEPGSNGLIFLPYLNGERTPHKNPNARGVFFGMSSFHKKSDMLRAIYEGVVFALRQGGECIKTLGNNFESIKVVGGGSRSDIWCQMIADNFKLPVNRLKVDEGAAYGSARLAGNYSGMNTNNWIEVISTFIPQEKNYNKYDKLFEEYKSLYNSLKKDFDIIAKYQEN